MAVAKLKGVSKEKASNLADLASQGLRLHLIHVCASDLQRGTEEVKGKSHTSGTPPPA